MSVYGRQVVGRIFTGLILLWAGSGIPFAQSSARADQAGTVVQATGDTRLSRTGFLATPVQKGTMLREGDRLRTGRDGRAELRMADQATVAIGPGSDFVVERYREESGSGSIGLRLAQGAVRIATGLFSKGNPEGFRLQTPTATLGVRGTEFSVEQGAETPSFAVRVFSGRVVVSSARGSVEVPTGGVLRIAAVNAAPEFVDPNTGASRPALTPPQPRPRPRPAPKTEEPTPPGFSSPTPRSSLAPDASSPSAQAPGEPSVVQEAPEASTAASTRPRSAMRGQGAFSVLGDGSYDAQSTGQASRLY